jgi:hypothetical protein
MSMAIFIDDTAKIQSERTFLWEIWPKLIKYGHFCKVVGNGVLPQTFSWEVIDNATLDGGRMKL